MLSLGSFCYSVSHTAQPDKGIPVWFSTVSVLVSQLQTHLFYFFSVCALWPPASVDIFLKLFSFNENIPSACAPS
jgi:hypothetical protein